MLTEIVLQHGWGFDGEMWSPWLGLLNENGRTPVIGERGYFGRTPVVPHFSEKAERRIAIVHSLGLHLLPDATIERADTVVCFGAFLNFHGEDEMRARRSRRVLGTMRAKFGAQPGTVLADFYRNCGLTGNYGRGEPRLYALQEDLRLLDESRFDANKLKDKRVIVFHGEEDRIAHPSVAKELHEAVDGSRLTFLEQRTHSLPFDDATVVATLRELLIPMGAVTLCSK